eukprot:1328507-Pleurochrysis_carterae.AAC.7
MRSVRSCHCSHTVHVTVSGIRSIPSCVNLLHIRVGRGWVGSAWGAERSYRDQAAAVIRARDHRSCVHTPWKQPDALLQPRTYRHMHVLLSAFARLAEFSACELCCDRASPSLLRFSRTHHASFSFHPNPVHRALANVLCAQRALETQRIRACAECMRGVQAAPKRDALAY